MTLSPTQIPHKLQARTLPSAVHCLSPKKSILLIKSTHTVTGRIQKERKEELQCHVQFVYGCQLMTFAMKNELSSCHCMLLQQATPHPWYMAALHSNRRNRWADEILPIQLYSLEDPEQMKKSHVTQLGEYYSDLTAYKSWLFCEFLFLLLSYSGQLG